MSSLPAFGYYGALKTKLEAVGVQFTKVEGVVWSADFEGQTIGSGRVLVDCIKNAAKALGEI